MEPVLWLMVQYSQAVHMMANRLQTEQTVKGLMEAWRTTTEAEWVYVIIQWQEIAIAVGEKNPGIALSGRDLGDTVTIKRP